MCGSAHVQASASTSYEDDSTSTKKRLDLMNLTVNIDKRIRNLFERIEKDILSAVCSQNMQIAPYSPIFTIGAGSA